MTQQPNDNQEKIQQLATDPEFLARAASSAMAKRQALMDRQQPNDSELRKKIEKRLQLMLIGEDHYDRFNKEVRRAQQDVIGEALDDIIPIVQGEAQEARIDELKTHSAQWEAYQDEPEEMVKVADVIKWYKVRIAELNQPNTNKEKRIMSKIPVFNRVSKFTDTVTLEHPRLESKTATAVALFDQWLRWCEEEGNLTARQITHVTKAFWLTPEEYEKKHAKSQTNGDLVGGVK